MLQAGLRSRTLTFSCSTMYGARRVDASRSLASCAVGRCFHREGNAATSLPVVPSSRDVRAEAWSTDSVVDL